MGTKKQRRRGEDILVTGKIHRHKTLLPHVFSHISI
jgi:hypothetical protein